MLLWISLEKVPRGRNPGVRLKGARRVANHVLVLLDTVVVIGI